ncbi:MAG: hypothetical protein ACT4NY_27995 [Pseudonocardiales bacterium]
MWRSARTRARPGCPAPAIYTEARHLGFSGSSLWELGMHGKFAAETRNRLSAAHAIRTDEGHRARTGGQIKLASLIITTGDPLEAVALGTQALDGMGSLRWCTHPMTPSSVR